MENCILKKGKLIYNLQLEYLQARLNMGNFGRQRGEGGGGGIGV